MPIYVYDCAACYNIAELIRPLAERDAPVKCPCGATMERKPTTGTFRMPGGNSKINYADAFTADALGVPINSLPDNLRTKR
jgi:putative FmdB family regulatory protein